jgi:spore germination protein KB
MKEFISSKQAIALIVAFILDGSIIFQTAPEAGRNVWISILIALVLSFISYTVYCIIQMSYPGKDLYEICQISLGKVVGNIVSVLYIWYFIHLGALTLRDFGEFMSVLTMPETPQTVIMVISTLISVYMVKKGIEVIGRFALPATIFSLINIGLLAFMLIPRIDIKNVLPILGEGISPVMEGAWTAFTFPFGECVLFLTVLSNLNDYRQTKKAYYAGLICGGALVLIEGFYEIAILGEAVYRSLYFPSYAALSRIRIGEFIQRLEIAAGINLNVFGIIKISLCLYAASMGISRMLDIKDYKVLALPVGLIMLNLSNILYTNIMELVSWTAKVYKYYALPFQIFFPAAIYAAIKIKKQ